MHRRRQSRELASVWVTPMWLAHHWPEDYERCVRIGRSHVCRRCLVLYPVAFGTALVLTALGVGSGAWVGWVYVLAPIPAVVEFVLEHVGVWRHRPARLVAVTLPLGVGLGAGFARYLEDLTDPLFWGIAALYGGVCGLSAWWSWRGDGG